MPGSKKRVLILSVSAGSGHTRASEALKAAFKELDENCHVEILDTFKYTSPFLEWLILGTYLNMLKFAPSLYGSIYNRSEKGRFLSGNAKKIFYNLLSRFTAVKLLEYIKHFNPDAIISTHPFPLGILAALRRMKQCPCFTAAAITDFVLHPYWVFPEIDLYLASSEEMVRDLLGYGLPAEKALLTGIPIDPIFNKQIDKIKFLEKHGLDPNLKTVLVMGGGLGIGPSQKSVESLGNLDLPCQLIVVAGFNAQLKQNIEKIAVSLPNRVCVFGYVNNIHELMAVSDIMVSKAGGLSCSEALASGLPVIILNPLPGQELWNSQYLVSQGAALQAGSVEELVKIARYLLEKPDTLAELSSRALKLARSNSSSLAARFIYQHINNT